VQRRRRMMPCAWRRRPDPSPVCAGPRLPLIRHNGHIRLVSLLRARARAASSFRVPASAAPLRTHKSACNCSSSARLLAAPGYRYRPPRAS
jgi:hypothetical protein